MNNEGRGLPLVTFAIFSYNQEAFIREAVKGALSQTYENLQVIISDDCSDDKTLDVIKEEVAGYEGPHKVIVRRNSKNLGLASHINEVVQISDGDFICWAAGDDISLPCRTEMLIAPMLNNENIFGVHSTVQEMDLNGSLGQVRDLSETTKYVSINGVLRSGSAVVSQAHAFRRKVFDVFGPLDSGLTNEGPVMAFRECLIGSVEYIDVPTVLYRVGSGVSTYQGKNKNKIQFDEPIKVCKWRLTAFQQILKDAEKVAGEISYEQMDMIKRNISFYENLLLINEKGKVFVPLLKNFFLFPFSQQSLRAALRVALPRMIYWRIRS